MKKSSLLFIGAGIVIAPISVDANFSDVESSNAHFEAINELSNRNVLNGYADGTFQPSKPLTRGQTSKILARVLNLHNQSTTSSFSDVPKEHPFYNEIQALVQAGIFNGYSNGTFRPDQALTRGEMAKVLTLGFQLDDASLINLPFHDISPNSEIQNYVKALYDRNITKGTSLTTFEPSKSLSRAEMASFVVRAERLKNKQPLQIEHTAPYDKSGKLYTAVSLNEQFIITFNEAVETEDVSVNLVSQDGTNFTTIINAVGRRLVIEPSEHLSANQYYTLSIDVAQDDSPQTTGATEILFKTTVDDAFNVTVTERQRHLTNLWGKLPKNFLQQVPEYTVKPQTQGPYQPGQLSQSTLDTALNVTKMVREVAFLTNDIQMTSAYNEAAQAAAVVNAANGQLSHYPVKPGSMSEDLFQLGYEGASSSNIGMGYHSINSSILYGYLEDGDPSNIASLGHRLWVLSPALNAVGFGYANNYTAMKVFGTDSYSQNAYREVDFVSWPAAIAMPTDLFNAYYPWSVSLEPERYTIDDNNAVVVTLQNQKTKETWEFSNKQADGFFNISNQGYGYRMPAIIFRPDEIKDYEAGDTFLVKVEGLQDTQTKQESILVMETRFFDFDE